MGFVRIFWKNNVQEAYLPKMSILGQIVSEIVAQLYPENSIQTLLISKGRPKKNLEGFVWNFLSITGLRSQRQFAPKCPFLASRPLGHCCFRISWQIPWFQKFHFYVVTLKFSIAQCHSGAVLRLTASQWYSRVIIQFSVFVWLDSINIWLYQGPLFFLLI